MMIAALIITALALIVTVATITVQRKKVNNYFKLEYHL